MDEKKSTASVILPFTCSPDSLIVTEKVLRWSSGDEIITIAVTETRRV